MISYARIVTLLQVAVNVFCLINTLLVVLTADGLMPNFDFIVKNDLTVGENVRINGNTLTIGPVITQVNGNIQLTTDRVVIDYSNKTQMRSVKYLAQVSTTTEHQISEILIVHNGVASQLTEYGVLTTGNQPLVDYSTDIDGNQVRLWCSVREGTGNVWFTKTSINSITQGSTTSYWVAQGGIDTTTFEACAFDSAGNIIAVGTVNDINDSAVSYSALLKISPAGQIIWARTLSNANTVWISEAVDCDAADNIYVGLSDYPNAAYLIKLDPNGNIVWQTNIQGTIYDVWVNPDGSSTVSMYTSAHPYILVRINAAGSVVWNRLFDDGTILVQDIMTVSYSGDNIVVGMTWFNLNSSENGTSLISLDTNGDLNWLNSISWDPSSYIGILNHRIGSDAQGNVYFSVSIEDQNFKFSTHVAKLNNLGVLQWIKKIEDPTYWIQTYAVSVDATGNTYCSGTYNQGQAIVIFKLDTDGNLVWNNLLSTGNDIGMFNSNGQRSLALFNTNFALAGYQSFTGRYALLASLPTDGSALGIHGAYTYATGSLTASAPQWTSSNVEITPSSITLSVDTDTSASSSELNFNWSITNF